MSRAKCGCGLLTFFLGSGLVGLCPGEAKLAPGDRPFVGVVDESQLVEGLNSSDPAVRQRTLTVLIDRPILSPYLLGKVIGRLSDCDGEVRETAISLLDRAGKRAVLPLCRALEGGTEPERIAVLAMLEHLRRQARAAIPALAKASRDKSPAIRACAVGAIGATADPAGLIHLRRALLDEDDVVRREGAYGLALLGPKAGDAAPALATLMKAFIGTDDAEGVGSAAVTALSCIGADAVPALLDLAKDTANPYVLRSTSLSALESMARQRVAALPTLAVPTLVTILGDHDENIRRNAVLVLRRIGPPARLALPTLAEVAKDRADWVRAEAAAAVYAIDPRDTSAVSILLACLITDDPNARKAACIELGEIGKPAARIVPAIEKRLKDQSSLVRQAAADTLMRLGPVAARAESALLECENDQDEYVRGAVQRALEAIRRK
jgi:HEAT repeat protein